MKSLIKRVAHSVVGIKFRNLIGFRPVIYSSKFKNLKSVSISDAFPWRTDNDYKATFKFTDLLGLFYKIENSFVL